MKGRKSRPAVDADVAAWARDLRIPGIFDIHVHFMPDRVQQAVWRHFDRLPRTWGIKYRGDEAERLMVLRQLGVRHHTALAYAHRPGMAAWLNDFTLEFAARVQTALPCFTFYPEPSVAEYVGAALARGGRVAKVHLQVGKFDPMRPELDPVWGMLEAARTPVIIHAGAVPDGSRGEEWCGMRPVRNLLRRWPGLVLILAHMGVPEYEDAVALAQEFPQLYMDTAMVLVDGQTGFEYPETLLGWLAESGERVLFGSDFPSFPHDYASQVRGLAKSGLGDDWLRLVMWENAARMFGLGPPAGA
ncbi:MAG TPA: amidohydrolase family protein [Candidatus Dormibacteraeota bacterium]|nr:amidohydrolase family protein [Candidatus Dormibacteraeota bacterium]